MAAYHCDFENVQKTSLRSFIRQQQSNAVNVPYMRSANHVKRGVTVNHQELQIKRLRILLAQEQRLSLSLNEKLKQQKSMASSDQTLISRLANRVTILEKIRLTRYEELKAQKEKLRLYEGKVKEQETKIRILKDLNKPLLEQANSMEDKNRALQQKLEKTIYNEHLMTDQFTQSIFTIHTLRNELNLSRFGRQNQEKIIEKVKSELSDEIFLQCMLCFDTFTRQESDPTVILNPKGRLIVAEDKGFSMNSILHSVLISVASICRFIPGLRFIPRMLTNSGQGPHQRSHQSTSTTADASTQTIARM